MSISKMTKGHNSVRSVGVVTVIHLCTLSDYTLYPYLVSRKYLRGFQSD